MRSIAEDAKVISKEFNISETAALAYLTLVVEGEMNLNQISKRLHISVGEAESCIEVMLGKGMVIRSPSGEGVFQPLHPRMAVTNLYKSLEEEVRVMLKQKRLVADSLSRRLSEPFENRSDNKS
ncbi:MAG: hypothetical protein HY619_06305 [Thaumarchaeota archaeon]|nr:hypothetical protein [Nitrososphaerota archaeon]